MCDCDAPQTMQKFNRLARVNHQCCECGDMIPAGAHYEYISGVWNNRGASFKTCLECAAIRNWFIAECLPSGECWPCFGNLIADATNGGSDGSRAELLAAATVAKYL